MEQTCKLYHCYKATNLVNGKLYIGFASDPPKRWSQHKRNAETGRGYVLAAAIRKHGWENFKFEVIYSGPDKKKILEEIEPALIEQHQSLVGQNGYNIRKAPVIGAYGRKTDVRGNKGRPLSEEHKQKVSRSLIGNHRRCGCKDSDEVRKKKSEVLMGNLRSLGRKHPPKILQKITEASKQMWTTKRSHCKKLTWEQAKAIRIERIAGSTHKSLATKYNVSISTISDIINLRTRYYA